MRGRREFVLGASAGLLAASSGLAMANTAVAADVDAAFAQGFKAAPRLTWEWESGYSLAGKPVTADEAMRWDSLSARQVRDAGTEAHKREARRALRQEFIAEYGPLKADSVPLPPSFDDEAANQAFDRACALDDSAFLEFRMQKHRAGLLPDWYVREYLEPASRVASA